MQDNSDSHIFEKIDHVIELTGKKVLEVGCGDGRISGYLILKTDQLTGIDPDMKKVEQARVAIPTGDFRIGSGEGLEFADHAFDIIIFTLSLHHQDSKKALCEASRVLKPDGTILVIEPLVEGEIERLFAVAENEDQAKMDAQRAIAESELCVEHAEAFDADWSFDSKEEVAGYIFDYCEMPFDPMLAQRMYALLGENRQRGALTLSDRMIIQVLTKNTAGCNN